MACGTSQIQVNPTQVRQEMGHPVHTYETLANCQGGENSSPSDLGPSLPVQRARVVHNVHGRRVEHVAQPHDPLRRDVLHHPIVQPGSSVDKCSLHVTRILLVAKIKKKVRAKIA